MVKVVPVDRLNEVGVKLILARPGWLLQCEACGRVWPYPTTGWVPHDYWHCPLRCNFTSGVYPDES